MNERGVGYFSRDVEVCDGGDSDDDDDDDVVVVGCCWLLLVVVVVGGGGGNVEFIFNTILIYNLSLFLSLHNRVIYRCTRQRRGGTQQHLCILWLKKISILI